MAEKQEALAETPKRRMKIKYLGGGYIYGVPARDLTADEYDEHRATILACPNAADLYRLPDGDTPAQARIRYREEA